MNKIALVISEAYNKVLPEVKRYKVQFNLEINDYESTTEQADELATEIENHLKSALKRTREGEIKITVKNGEIAISDTGTTLSRPVCQLLSHGNVSVKSRVGFGTTVKINLKSDKSKHKQLTENSPAKK